MSMLLYVAATREQLILLHRSTTNLIDTFFIYFIPFCFQNLNARDRNRRARTILQQIRPSRSACSPAQYPSIDASRCHTKQNRKSKMKSEQEEMIISWCLTVIPACRRLRVASCASGFRLISTVCSNLQRRY